MAGDAGYRIVSRLSGKCIGADPKGTAVGGRILQSPCGNSPSQLWAMASAGNGYVLRNLASRLCMDVPGASLENGTQLLAWNCNGGINQTWRYQSLVTP